MPLFYLAPAWVLIVAITFAFVAISCGGHVLVRRSFAQTDFIEHNEVAGFVVAVVGVLYAVLLAFITIVVWEHFAAAEDRASQEVDAATDILRFSAYLAPSDGRRLMNDLDRYVEVVISDEWPAMAHGRSSTQAQDDVVRLLGDTVALPVNTLRQANLQNRLLDRVQTVADLRRRRISDNQSGVPSVLWVALIVGASTVIGFLYLFGLKNFRVQLLMTALTATVIGLSFSVVIALDFPFRGDISISPERWIALHELITAGR